MEMRKLAASLKEFDKDEFDRIMRAILEGLATALPLERIGGIDFEQMKQDYAHGVYHVLPCPEHDWCYTLYRPRHYPLNVGILDEFRSGPVFLCFHANRISKWVSPMPEDLAVQLEFPETIDAKVNKDATTVTFREKEALVAFSQYKQYLGTKISKTQWQIKPKLKWQFLCNLVMDGVLPFTPEPVDPNDLRENPLKTKFELREDQKKWHEELLTNGRVGNFAPMGEGKMFWGVWELCHFKPPLFVAGMPGTLEMWKERIRRDVVEADKLLSEIDFISLRQAERFADAKHKKEYVLGIGDEFHRSPAPTHSPIFQIPVKYFIAETATPYREGPRGREEVALLMTMAHHPLAISWSEILKKRLNIPSVDVWIVKNWEHKMELVRHMLSKAGGQHLPTILFTWERELGDELVRLFAPKTEPVTGLTSVKERILLVEKYLSEPPLRAVVSTVGSESWDLPQLQCVIEVGFHKGSRVEEIQRIGRLMHSKYRGEYHTIYTEDEWVRFGWKRTMAAEEKGLLTAQHFEDVELEKLSHTVRPHLTRRLGATTRRAIQRPQESLIQKEHGRREIPVAITQRLPAGVIKILNQLEATDFQVVCTMLANPTQTYGVLQLRHATGLSASTISGNAHFGKLRKEGLIKKVGRGSYQAAM